MEYCRDDEHASCRYGPYGHDAKRPWYLIATFMPYPTREKEMYLEVCIQLFNLFTGLSVLNKESDSTVPVLNRPQVSGNQLSSWNYICTRNKIEGKMFLRSLFNHIELNKAELETNFEKRMPLQFHISRSMKFKWKKIGSKA